MALTTEEKEKLYRGYVEIVTDCRKDNSISQAALSKAAGCSDKYVTLIESGKRVPSFEMMVTLMACAGVRRSVAVELFERIVDDLEWREE
jgi:transcriptional regulator with XRE-family HTH domain